MVRYFFRDELVQRFHWSGDESSDQLVDHAWPQNDIGIEEVVAEFHWRLDGLIVGVSPNEMGAQQTVAEAERC